MNDKTFAEVLATYEKQNEEIKETLARLRSLPNDGVVPVPCDALDDLESGVRSAHAYCHEPQLCPSGVTEKPMSYMNIPQSTVTLTTFDPPNAVPMPNMEYMTPDALLVYCQTRLSALDADIRKRFEQQKTVMADKKVLADTKKWMADYAGAGISQNDPQRMHDFYTALQNGANAAKDPAVKAKLQELANQVKSQITYTVNGDGTLTPSSCKGEYKLEDMQHQFGDVLSQLDSSLGQAAELNMIELQSIMSQRQTALQLTTNLIQAIGDSAKTIAGNVGK